MRAVCADDRSGKASPQPLSKREGLIDRLEKASPQPLSKREGLDNPLSCACVPCAHSRETAHRVCIRDWKGLARRAEAIAKPWKARPR